MMDAIQKAAQALAQLSAEWRLRLSDGGTLSPDARIRNAHRYGYPLLNTVLGCRHA